LDIFGNTYITQTNSKDSNWDFSVSQMNQ